MLRRIDVRIRHWPLPRSLKSDCRSGPVAGQAIAWTVNEVTGADFCAAYAQKMTATHMDVAMQPSPGELEWEKTFNQLSNGLRASISLPHLAILKKWKQAVDNRR
jgi:hypothetical protein